MPKRNVTIAFVVIAFVLVVLIGRFGFTVVKIADEEKAVQNETFDPAKFVDGIWSSKLLPTFNEKSVELSTILSQIHVDYAGSAPKDALTLIAKKYGLITVGEAHVYMVKGNGKVINVDTETSLGTAEIKLDDYDGPIKVLLYIGTRIPSDETSARDAVGFINFGDFKEQTEYGKISSEINKRIIKDVLGNLDKQNLIGKTISFEGAFNIRTFNLFQINLKQIYIVPVKIELGE